MPSPQAGSAPRRESPAAHAVTGDSAKAAPYGILSSGGTALWTDWVTAQAVGATERHDSSAISKKGQRLSDSRLGRSGELQRRKVRFGSEPISHCWRTFARIR